MVTSCQARPFECDELLFRDRTSCKTSSDYRASSTPSRTNTDGGPILIFLQTVTFSPAR
jgi:hypothetical protein